MGLVKVYRRQGNRTVFDRAISRSGPFQASPLSIMLYAIETEQREQAATACEAPEKDDIQLPAKLEVKIRRDDRPRNDWWAYDSPPFERSWKNWRETRYHRIFAA